MTTFKKKIAAALTSGAMFLSMTSTAFASTSIEVTGNGYDSSNSSNVSAQTSTNVVQDNSASVSNRVSSSSNTGGNKADQNTNGDVIIRTGDAQTKVNVDNMLNSNKAMLDCCSTAGDTDVTVSGNGAKSNSDVSLSKDANTSVFQTNVADVKNDIDAIAKTGENQANQNTGGTVNGGVAIRTGDARTNVDVATAANVNVAQVGGNGHVAGDTTAKIIGNGYNSDNSIDLSENNSTNVVQDNYADVYNSIEADAKTGYNKANQNTGGDTLIYTGDAKVNVAVDNMVNFNWANVDCGCQMSDLAVKVAGNGADSWNDVAVSHDSAKDAFQTNDANLDNWVDGNAKTGDNSVKQSTGSVNGDPAIWTGDSASSFDVANSGNSNSYGSDMPASWPNMSNMDFHFSFSLGDLMAWAGHN